MRTPRIQSLALCGVFGLIGCSSTDGTANTPAGSVGGSSSANPSGGRGPSNSGGNGTTPHSSGPSTGGFTSSTGGQLAAGGAATGGAASGGRNATGGAATGGNVVGGAATGGTKATGGAASGGNGTSAGGNATGGTKVTTGGSSAGSSATGGSAVGGAATGGTKATGGNATGGAATGGTKATGGAATGGSSSNINCSGPALTSGTQICSANQTGMDGSYGWQVWSANPGGCITPHGVGAAFKATWSGTGDFLAREGCKWDSTKTYDKYSDVTADYAFTKTGTAGDYSYIGIYGWSTNPLIEFYIVDDWFGTGGPPTASGTLVTSFDVDGGTYNIYKHQQVDQYSVLGTKDTFWQYFSIRQTRRQCGHIDVSAHFKKWANLGLTMGVMFEAKLIVEAGDGSGSIDFTYATMNCN